MADTVYEVPRGQMPADGKCGMCTNSVPADMVNRFYCSWGCASLAWSYYADRKREQEEEDNYRY